MSINKVILVGRIGANPRVAHLADGREVVSLTLATDEHFGNRDASLPKRPEWHDVVIFGQAAKFASERLGKGDQVYVEGRLRRRRWQGKDGVERSTVEVVANDVQLISKSKRSRREDEKEQQEPAPKDGVENGDIPF
jgi:single-strand DNA-binding protein